MFMNDITIIPLEKVRFLINKSIEILHNFYCFILICTAYRVIHDNHINKVPSQSYVKNRVKSFAHKVECIRLRFSYFLLLSSHLFSTSAACISSCDFWRETSLMNFNKLAKVTQSVVN
ncbi:hypothetical protein KUTeg_022913 [Tegillarca granosa]|uniref:Uncharacterized protein n=1 Tax=Tegillarca granosa TaxID=220873 RepID=A0ABQ9E049_TEGGR|nr:hypothetical protein KUTeg_022913 [Tegillarca granosa]